MNREPTTTRVVRSWLQGGVTLLPDRVLDRVLDEVAVTRQRRHPWSVGLFLKTAAAAAVAVVVAIVGSGVLPITRNVGDAPPHATVTPRISLGADQLTTASVLDVDLVFTVPEGWSAGDIGTDHVEITRGPPDQGIRPSDRPGVGIFLIDNLFADPCAPDDRMVDPPIGPSVEDLADGLASVAGYGGSTPVATTIDGYRGLRMDLDPVFFGCPISDAHLWTTPDGSVQSVRADEERHTLWILDVDGVRLVVDAYTPSGSADDDDRAELESIVASIRIEP